MHFLFKLLKCIAAWFILRTELMPHLRTMSLSFYLFPHSYKASDQDQKSSSACILAQNNLIFMIYKLSQSGTHNCNILRCIKIHMQHFRWITSCFFDLTVSRIMNFRHSTWRIGYIWLDSMCRGANFPWPVCEVWKTAWTCAWKAQAFLSHD